MKILIAAIAALFAALLLLSLPAGAAETKGSLDKLQSLSTGVGLEEREQTPAGYQAKLVFASPRGELFAGVEVVILRGGEERKAMSSGPWLLLKGEPGEYEIRASAGGARGTMKIRLTAAGMGTFVIHLREPRKARMSN